MIIERVPSPRVEAVPGVIAEYVIDAPIAGQSLQSRHRSIGT